MDNNSFENDIISEEKAQNSEPMVRLSTVIKCSAAFFLVFSICFAVLVKTGFVRIGVEDKASEEEKQLHNRFDEVYKHLDRFYMGEYDNDEMITTALKAYVAAVGDPYTEYMEQSYAEGFIDGNYGSKSGIGVRIFQSLQPCGIYVKHVIAGSPAEKAGMLADDIIVAVNNTAVTDNNYTEAIDMISGEKGTTVTLSIQRGDKVKILQVVRGDYTASPIDYKLMNGEEGIAYVRIHGFSKDCSKALKAAIEKLKEDGARAYIFDVRDDGGGYLDEVISMLDMLLPEGPIVRYSYTGDKGQNVTTSDASVIVKAPMAVLMNGNTASAAELFSAALKDYKLATLIGEKSYGKGVIQTVYRLNNGDSIKITTGEYSPPYSDNFHGVGIMPDVEVSLPDGKRYDQLSDKEDTQLQAAVSALKNKLLQD